MTAGSGSPTPSLVVDQLPARGRLSSSSTRSFGLPNRATVATWLANPGGIEPVMAVGVMKPTGMASAVTYRSRPLERGAVSLRRLGARARGFGAAVHRGRRRHVLTDSRIASTIVTEFRARIGWLHPVNGE
jgi:hypothetical protein